MLPLRLGIFAALFAVALSGLFSLLDNLSEPELLRSKRVVVVKGCDPMEHEDAARLCPQLFCQKFLLDARAVELRSQFQITVDQRSGNEQLIGGIARMPGAAAANTAGESFACLLENTKVTAGRLLEAKALEELQVHPEEWATLAQAENRR